MSSVLAKITSEKYFHKGSAMCSTQNVKNDENITAADDSSGDDVTTDTQESGKDDVSNVDHPFKSSNDTSDLRLLVEGRPLYVSRVVLSLVSPVLKSRLQNRLSEDTIELPLPGQKYTEMVEFLCCIYPGILAPLTEKNIGVILRLADEFQVQRQVEKCEEYLTKDIENAANQPEPEKIVRYLYLSDKYGLEELQKATFEAAAKTRSDLLENVRDFWELPSVTTTSVFIRRLKLLEKQGKTIRAKIKDIQNHCTLYHKGDRNVDGMCSKCFVSIGRYANAELKHL